MTQSRYDKDQASRLRQLSLPAHSDVTSDLAFRSTRGPRLVVVSEIPHNSGSIHLAWHLSQEACRRGERCLLVDLAPASSLLPTALEPVLSSLKLSPQPLWENSTSGRKLANWIPSRVHQLDVAAQPICDFPFPDEMARICEQLIRRIGQHSSTTGCPWHTIIVLSSSIGIPHDTVCWSVADEIITISSRSTTDQFVAPTSLSARLPMIVPGQRRLQLWKRCQSLRGLLWRHALRSCSSPELDWGGPINMVADLEHFDVPWPRMLLNPHRKRAKSKNRNIARIAKSLWNELGSGKPTLGFRQAS